MAGTADTSKAETREEIIRTTGPEAAAQGDQKEHVWLRFMTKIGWYPKDMPVKEKQLVLKLDLSILIFGCLSFFTKYLDQQSLTNAYVRFVFADMEHLDASTLISHHFLQRNERRDWPERERTQLYNGDILGILLHSYDSSMLLSDTLSG